MFVSVPSAIFSDFHTNFPSAESRTLVLSGPCSMIQSVNVPVCSEPSLAVYVNVLSCVAVESSLIYRYAMSNPTISSGIVSFSSLYLKSGIGKKPLIWYLGGVVTAEFSRTMDWNELTSVEYVVCRLLRSLTLVAICCYKALYAYCSEIPCASDFCDAMVCLRDAICDFTDCISAAVFLTSVVSIAAFICVFI